MTHAPIQTMLVAKVHEWKWLVFYATILHLYSYTVPGTTWANEMNFVKNNAPSAGPMLIKFHEVYIVLYIGYNVCKPHSTF